MRDVFNAKIHRGQWLDIAEFKVECTRNLMFWEVDRFTKMAGILLFVEPRAAASCRKWFVEHTILMRLFSAVEGADLVDLTRYIWKSQTFSREMTCDSTLDALGRLDDAHVKALCITLMDEHGTNRWLAEQLSPYVVRYDNIQAAPVSPIESIKLSSWYVESDATECPFCGHKPPQSFVPWKNPIDATCRRLFNRFLKCEFCNLHTPSPTPIEQTISNEPRRGPMEDEENSDEVQDGPIADQHNRLPIVQ
ncbi:hypothetical protein PSACC_01767 [Paramicrosporidium saccamoebae]|uniref:Uncharacterized protein n=1 Tax=Paramicrosporidium saccamoebae TaxID=1246581 RepID=A0A2H9TL23_9FUNG|nr:hypothetical protein PSACC_01767 [Paramicrosporidium saccamoebae]